MELSQLATAETHQEGAECNISDPLTRKPTDVYIKIMGADSAKWREQKKKQTNAVLEQRASAKKSAIDFDKMDVDALVQVTIGWRGISLDGKEYTFSKDNARNLYTNSPSVVAQLLEFLGNGANFIKG